MGVPLYFFESNSLNFTQSEIGQLAAYNSVGMLIGTMFYRHVMKNISAAVAVALRNCTGVFEHAGLLLDFQFRFCSCA